MSLTVFPIEKNKHKNHNIVASPKRKNNRHIRDEKEVASWRNYKLSRSREKSKKMGNKSQIIL